MKNERHPKDALPILSFKTTADWEAWLERQPADSTGLWVRIYKKETGRPTITYAEALDGALCFGWIDGQKDKYDDEAWLQKFTPRRPRSNWSQINVKKVDALTAAGRMRPAGLATVEQAKADGRWAKAYAPQSQATVPEDLQAALDKNKAAREFFATLKGANRYAIMFRVRDAKRPETRARLIAGFVDMLKRKETIYPVPQPKAGKSAAASKPAARAKTPTKKRARP